MTVQSQPRSHNRQAHELNEMHEAGQVPHDAAHGLLNDIVDGSLHGYRTAQDCLRQLNPLYVNAH